MRSITVTLVIETTCNLELFNDYLSGPCEDSSVEQDLLDGGFLSIGETLVSAVAVEGDGK